MSNYEYELLLTEALSNRQQRRHLIRDLNKALPAGHNRWFHLQPHAKRAAYTAAQQMTQRTGRPFSVHHHIYQPLCLRHYHLATPDGRSLRIRFLYFEVVPNLPTEIEDEAGAYGETYPTARQAFLRALQDDPNQPNYIQGWVRQELNRLERVSQARQIGQRPPGGNKRRVRGVPGFDVGHRVPGLHDPANFRVEHASTNRARPGIARRLGITRWR
jgi:hypothetical protein